MMQTTTNRQHDAFTLIELLVVISIVSLLIAILLPALATARLNARQIQCATGQKQIGIAFLIYGQDNNQFFPHPIGRYTNAAGASVNYDPAAPSESRYCWYIGKYINNAWWYENRTTNAKWAFPNAVQCPERINITSSYHFGMNSSYNGFYWKVLNPSKTVLLGDATSFYFNSNRWTGNFQYRHMARNGVNSGNINLLFGDMHVSTIKSSSGLLTTPYDSCKLLVVKKSG